MKIEKLNEELQKTLSENILEKTTFVNFDKRMDWAYGRIKTLDYKYQHSIINKREYIDSAIDMANEIIKSANLAKEDLQEE